jgi:hypothetical protein
MKLTTSLPIHSALAGLALAACAFLSLSPTASAGTASSKAVVETKAPEPWLHALLQLDLSDHYITPRGLNVENKGIIFQPLFLVFANLYSEPAGFLQDVTLVGGVWASLHSEESGADPGNWNEWDPILGLSFKFADVWKLDTTFTCFDSLTDSYPTSTHFEAKLSFDDSKYLGSFALHPWVAFWQELDEKATVVFNPATSDESFYFTIGVNPSFSLGKVKFEFPTWINLVDEDFYQQFDGSPGGSGLAVFCTGVKASVPLTFVPKDLGFWTLYAGVKYYRLDNAGLEDGNSVLTPREHREDLVQFHGGISIFF